MTCYPTHLSYEVYTSLLFGRGKNKYADKTNLWLLPVPGKDQVSPHWRRVLRQTWSPVGKEQGLFLPFPLGKFQWWLEKSYDGCCPITSTIRKAYLLVIETGNHFRPRSCSETMQLFAATRGQEENLIASKIPNRQKVRHKVYIAFFYDVGRTLRMGKEY